ncbi:hypothetical protein WIS52_01840 [Pseudonocardia nematodicida]|uniref:Mannose-6-phosphate isomerase class I n=1 Tax=Pseudonocardia nematodicida TaxID=1206997 RepID=A0ABV1K766_9PSEU
MHDLPARDYEANPCYPAVGGVPGLGWDAVAAALPAGPGVLAVDGPAVLGWTPAIDELTAALRRRNVAVTLLDVRSHWASWPAIVERTGAPELRDDPHFDRLATGTLDVLFDELPTPQRPEEGVLVVFGPGAALVAHDVLWYADLPKRYAEAAVTDGSARNLGQCADDGPPTTKRLFYIDWPLLDAHRDAVAGDLDRWIDCQDPRHPASLDGDALRSTLDRLAGRPFRTRPTFNTTSWGGHWAQKELGHNPEARNTALGYELIAPESGVLVGTAEAALEIPFQLVVAQHPERVMGQQVHERFGTSFPIRFDYLDTVGGGNLSVHCHPQETYMRETFGWPYTQHETYYLMVGGEENTVFLGLQGDVDVDAFHRDAHLARDHGQELDIEAYVRTFPATEHQLFVIPAGTPHGSGEGNVVLEVSATPYLYSLRFYDWLRRDADGSQRPTPLEHAFGNLSTHRTGDAVADDLVQEPRPIRKGDGWVEEMIGALPEMFFEVRRLVLDGDEPVDDDAGDRFHLLNVVEGDGVVIETADGHVHDLAYAETIVVPAAAGAYRLRRTGRGRVRLVKSLVP